MSGAKVKMRVETPQIIVFFALVLHCNALNCRSDGGPKEDELKTIYRNCLRKQDGKNSSSTRGHTDDDWRDSKGHSQRSPWDRESRLGRDDRRDDRMGTGREDGYRDDRMGNDGMYRDDRMSSSYDRMGTNYDRMGSNYDRMGSNYDRMGSNYDRMGTSNYDRMGDRDDRMSSNDRMGGRNEMMSSRNNGYGGSQISARDDFPQSEDFGDMYRSTTQSSRRYRREKRVGTNSGQRSQYNPNTSQRPAFDDSFRDERNTSNNSSKLADHKACAMHCFLENLEMTGDNGMPDRYLVTHAITKDVKNEDLRDFLQESIEECFQILDNENTEDKCEFSKNLLMCLSEKGRANCDDWKDDIQF